MYSYGYLIDVCLLTEHILHECLDIVCFVNHFYPQLLELQLAQGFQKIFNEWINAIKPTNMYGYRMVVVTTTQLLAMEDP